MPTLHIQLLGGFRILYDDVPITTLNSVRLQSLLAYLLLQRAAPQSRQHLAFLFWPDSTEKQARTNLRHQFHLLRQAHPIFEPLLLGDAQTVQWESALLLQLDVADFEATSGSEASLRELQTAVELYQGDLLPSCYEDWILPLRERLRQRFLETLERLIGTLEQSGDYSGAIRYAERLNRFDPLYEATYRQLMRLYAISGDQASIERIYQSCVALMQRELAAPPTLATQQLYRQLIGLETPLRERHNLVASLTPFVGREAELTKLTTLLADPACRLLTILGTGGIGKTRLALEAAQRQIGRFLHGIYVVPLAAVSGPEFMVSTLADQLKFTFYGPQEPSVQLLNYLREKEMLLVLDNIEHLLAGSDLLVKILQHAPAVKLLITSRERLKIAGEWLYEIQGLHVPSSQQVEQGNEFSAVQLFIQSAQRAQTDFIPNAEEMAAIVHLCQLVEGMPLGIELAASWIRLLSCAEIVQEVTQSLDLLTTSAPTGLERHRSMRAVFDHSWHLLTPNEQQIFRRLAVFQGGFRRDSATQVAGASLALLAALVDKSLLRRNQQGRYEMHELIHQYAMEKLAEVATEKETTQDRHGRYYLEFLHQQEKRFKSNQQQQALLEIRMEIDNVRLASQRAIVRTWTKELGQATQALLQFYDIQGWLHEAEAFSRKAVEEWSNKQEDWIEEGQDRVIGLGQVLALQGWFSLRIGMIRKARELFQESVALLRRFATRVELGEILQFFAMVAWASGDYREAQAILQEGLTIFREQETNWSIALCLGVMGNVAAALGNYHEAKQLLEQSMTRFKEAGDPRSTTLSISYLISVVLMSGNNSEANQWLQELQESLRLSRQIGDRWSMVLCLHELGAINYRSGAANWLEAKRLHEECLTIAKDLGDQHEIAVSLNHLGYVTCALADYTAAKQHFLTALRTTTEVQLLPLALVALVGLATLFCRQPVEENESNLIKAQEQAAELLAFAMSHPAATQETKDKGLFLWDEIASMLLPAQLMAAQERGQDRTLEEIATMLLIEHR